MSNEFTMSDTNKDLTLDGNGHTEATSGHAPLIQISHPNVPQGSEAGVDNPVFDLIDEQEPVDHTSDSRPSSAASQQSTALVDLRKGSLLVDVTIKEHSPSDSEQSGGEDTLSETDQPSGGPTLNVPQGISECH